MLNHLWVHLASVPLDNCLMCNVVIKRTKQTNMQRVNHDMQAMSNPCGRQSDPSSIKLIPAKCEMNDIRLFECSLKALYDIIITNDHNSRAYKPLVTFDLR